MANLEKIKIVKSSVTIPMYFYNIIVPQISDYYSQYQVDFDSKPVVCCPIHDEETPSMRYYEETNSFFCFGCGVGGDVIELHRRFTEKQSGYLPTADESSDFLYNYFVVGRENYRMVNSNGRSNEEQLSTKVEIMRLSKYIDTLENELLVDSSIQIKKKIIIWDKIDNIKCLIDKNKINAKVALDSIKQTVMDTI